MYKRAPRRKGHWRHKPKDQPVGTCRLATCGALFWHWPLRPDRSMVHFRSASESKNILNGCLLIFFDEVFLLGKKVLRDQVPAAIRCGYYS
jgi:hypothetical protein